MAIRTAVVIVMYNQWCGDAVTCSAIAKNRQQPDLILIVDNSTKEMNNRAYCSQRGWMYLSMEGNAGLSKAYNAAASILQGKADLVVWADDDTVFPEDYFEKLTDYAQRVPEADVFMPVVRTKTVILSPAVYTQRLVFPVEDLDDLKGREITGINSGLAVRVSLYEDYRYDENIFLDYVDHDFLRTCRLSGKKLQIMDDVVLFQNFFAEGNPSPAAKKHRMKIYMKDIRVFEAKCGKNRLLTEWDLLKYRYFQWRSFRKRRISEKKA